MAQLIPEHIYYKIIQYVSSPLADVIKQIERDRNDVFKTSRYKPNFFTYVKYYWNKDTYCHHCFKKYPRKILKNFFYSPPKVEDCWIVYKCDMCIVKNDL